MPHLAIKIHRCNETGPAYPDLKTEVELQFKNCIVVEEGMGSGEPALAFVLIDPLTGKNYIAQTSAAILTGLMSAVKGAREHWLEFPVENVWKDKLGRAGLRNHFL